MELATLLLKVDATGAVRSVKELNKELDATKQEATEATEATGKLGTAMKVAAAAGVLAMAAAMRKMVAESIEAQYAQAQLEAALKSTGGVARQNIKALNEWDSRFAGNVDWRQKLDSQRGAGNKILTNDTNWNWIEFT